LTLSSRIEVGFIYEPVDEVPECPVTEMNSGLLVSAASEHEIIAAFHSVVDK